MCCRDPVVLRFHPLGNGRDDYGGVGSAGGGQSAGGSGQGENIPRALGCPQHQRQVI